jgi:hypothetical protein
MNRRASAPRAESTRRPVGRVVLAALVLGALALPSLAVPAQPAEATSFRFWSYWLGADGAWSFSAQGAARVPADGTVDGWRFAVSAATGSSTPPRARPAFGALCGDTQPVAGSKRVGLVVDFGADDEAPPGESPPGVTLARCVVVPASATGYDVLAAADLPLRLKGGLVCGIDGYPATGCGEPVREAGSGGSSGSAPSGGGTGSSGGSSGGSVSSGGNGTGGVATTPGSGGGASPAPGEPKRSPAATPSPSPSGSSSAPPTVAALPPAATTADESAGGAGAPSPALWAGIVVVVGLIGAGVAVSRRRR